MVDNVTGIEYINWGECDQKVTIFVSHFVSKIFAPAEIHFGRSSNWPSDHLRLEYFRWRRNLIATFGYFVAFGVRGRMGIVR